MIENELRDITKNSGYLFTGKIFEAGINLLFNFIVARYLGAAIYGQFIIAFVFVSFVSIILRMGFDQALIYYIPKYKIENENYRISEIISFTLIFTSLFSIILSFCIYVFSEKIALLLNSPESGLYIRFFAFFIIINPLITILFGAFRGINKVRQYVIQFNFIRPVLRVIILVVMLVLGLKFYSIPTAYYIAMFVPLTTLTYLLWKQNLIQFINVKSARFYIKILKFGLPILFSTLLAFILMQTDVLMVGYFLKDKDVGIYNIALRIGTLTSLLLIAINANFAPAISKLFHKKQINELGDLYKILTRWILTANLLVFSIIFLYNKNIMGVFGYEFELGAISLLVISLGQLINGATGSCGMILAMTGFPSYEMYGNILNLAIKVGLNIFLIPIMGILGAALATALSIALINIFKLGLVYFKHKIIPYEKRYVNIFVVIIPLTFIAYFLKQQIEILKKEEYFIFFILIFIVTAFFILMKFSFTPLDKKLFRDMRNRFKLKVFRF